VSRLAILFGAVFALCAPIALPVPAGARAQDATVAQLRASPRIALAEPLDGDGAR
jgi:hypothetical protein